MYEYNTKFGEIIRDQVRSDLIPIYKFLQKRSIRTISYKSPDYNLSFDLWGEKTKIIGEDHKIWKTFAIRCQNICNILTKYNVYGLAISEQDEPQNIDLWVDSTSRIPDRLYSVLNIYGSIYVSESGYMNLISPEVKQQ